MTRSAAVSAAVGRAGGGRAVGCQPADAVLSRGAGSAGAPVDLGCDRALAGRTVRTDPPGGLRCGGGAGGRDTGGWPGRACHRGPVRYLAEPHNPADLAQALRRAAIADADTRQQMRGHGREILRGFDYRDSVRSLIRQIAPWLTPAGWPSVQVSAAAGGPIGRRGVTAFAAGAPSTVGSPA